MKKKILLMIAAMLFSLGIISTTNVANAYKAYQCRVVPAHKYHGYWYPAKKVCVKVHCKWVKSHWMNGRYYPAQRFCWYRR